MQTDAPNCALCDPMPKSPLRRRLYVHSPLSASKRRTTAPLHPDLAAILPGAEEANALQERVLHAYNDENGLPPQWNEQLRKLVETHTSGVAC